MKSRNDLICQFGKSHHGLYQVYTWCQNKTHTVSNTDIYLFLLSERAEMTTAQNQSAKNRSVLARFGEFLVIFVDFRLESVRWRTFVGRAKVENGAKLRFCAGVFTCFRGLPTFACQGRRQRIN